MTDDAIAKVQRLEDALSNLPQECLHTDHVIHGGMYARTIKIPAGVVITGVLIKIPTTLIVNGDCEVFNGAGSRRIVGHHVLAGSAGRKQAFIAHSDTWLTMVCRSEATTVIAAEEAFTDFAADLLSRKGGTNTALVTGE